MSHDESETGRKRRRTQLRMNQQAAAAAARPSWDEWESLMSHHTHTHTHTHTNKIWRRTHRKTLTMWFLIKSQSINTYPTESVTKQYASLKSTISRLINKLIDSKLMIASSSDVNVFCFQQLKCVDLSGFMCHKCQWTENILVQKTQLIEKHIWKLISRSMDNKSTSLTFFSTWFYN